MSTYLEFEPAPEYESTPTFLCLPKQLEEAMQCAPRTLERLKGCLLLAHTASSVDPELEDSAARVGAFVRGALAEYSSVDDMVEYDFPHRSRPFRLRDTNNPLPHVLKQLRHLQVHWVSSQLKDGVVSLWLKNVPGAEPVDTTKWFIEDLTESQLFSLNAFKGESPLYSADQAGNMVRWFNSAQEQFGIVDVIWRGVVDATERLCKQCGSDGV